MESLLGEIRRLEMVDKKSRVLQTEEKLSSLRDKLNLLLMDKAKASLRRCKQAFYEYGNKPSRMLANALRETKAQNHIDYNKTAGDVLVNTSQEIAKAFRNYYTSLYQLGDQQKPSKIPYREGEAKEYIGVSGKPRLPEDIVEDTDGPITAEEFLDTLKMLKPGKPPSPDGFTLLYYKTYAKKIDAKIFGCF